MHDINSRDLTMVKPIRLVLFVNDDDDDDDNSDDDDTVMFVDSVVDLT